LLHYNAQPHRLATHRGEDWLAHLPDGGFRAMCAWERFCTFAREPERRKVGGDARITVEGVVYEFDPELAGETVILWWGLFDQDLFVEFGECRFGPYRPSGGPIALHRYRKAKRTARDERADRITTLATRLTVPRAALTGHAEPEGIVDQRSALLPSRPFVDPDLFRAVFPRRLRPSVPSPTNWACHSANSRSRSVPDRHNSAGDPRAQHRAGSRPPTLPRRAREAAGAERSHGALRPGVTAR
jgi:hypothetical protein